MVCAAVGWKAAALAEETRAFSIHGEYVATGEIHRTGGAGDKTLLRRGEFFTNELRLTTDQALAGWDWINQVHLRKTPDPKIDKRKDLHLLGFTSELSNPLWRFTAGDLFADLSQYTMTTAARGAQAVFKNERFEAKAVAGYSNAANGGANYLRYVYGTRWESLLAKEIAMFKDLRVGVNFSGAEDDASSIDFAHDVADASNRVGSVTAKFKLWDSTDVDGELAKSWTDENTADLNDVDRKMGTALRLRSDTRLEKTKLGLGYEWVGADFRTLNGSAIPDKVEVSSRLDHRFNSYWAGEAGYRIFYDKLDKSALNKRTMTQAPTLAINWTPASEEWLLKDFYSRAYCDRRERVSQDDDTGQVDFLSHETGFQSEFMMDRTRWNVEYAIREEDDDFTKTNDRLIHIGSAGAHWSQLFFGKETRPSIGYHFDYEDRPKEEGHDFTQSVTLGLAMDLSERTKLEQRYAVEMASLLAENADHARFNAYLGLDYAIDPNGSKIFRVTFEHTTFGHESATEKFSENNFQMQFLWKF